jgi:hypothetical protein
VGVGQPDKVEALADVGRAEARRAGILLPKGVTQHFQRNPYNVDPRPSVSARNLLAKADDRAQLSGEALNLGP